MKGKWISTEHKLHPDKPGLHRYEHVPCLVLYKGDLRFLLWNCEHLVWDDDSGDDFFCHANEVDFWHEAIGPDTSDTTAPAPGKEGEE